MKKIIIAIVLLIAVNTIKAQGNLQFNQVINISNTLVVSDGSTVTFQTFTVPSGRVLKIESANFARKVSSNYYSTSFSGTLHIDDNILMNYSQSYVTGGGSDASIGDIRSVGHFPYWLGPGTYNFKVSCSHLGGTSTSDEFSANFSAIEFNIIP
jgi:hypothetical protein